MTHRILVVDDEPAMIEYLTDILEAHSFEVRGESSGPAALAALEQWPCDLVLSDVVMPGMRGTELLRAILAERPEQKVILMTAFGSIELAIQSIKAGAADFVIKPFKHKVLLQLLRDLLGDSPRASADAEGECLIAESEAMQQLMTLARRAALTQAPALITGESGVGKGALARMMHEQSQRRAAPLVQANCAALSPAHAEATLFGVDSERPGLLMRAHGGTLLLDEIAELGVALQPRLLEVLESGRLHGQPLDIRLITATNRDLDEAVAAGLFRAELLWRLRVVHLHIPPLRERATDLPSLATQLLAQHAPRLGHRALALSEDAQQALMRYDWPGNIRELDNLLYRAAILCKQSTIEARDLGLPSERWITSPASPGAVAGASGDEEFPSLPELERQHIQRALELAQGNKSQAARLLGIHRKTLYRKLEEQGISVDED